MLDVTGESDLPRARARRIGLPLIIALAFGLTACGGEEESNEEPGDSTEAPADSPDEPTADEPAGPPTPTWPTEGEVAGRLEGLDPVPINPAPQTVGSLRLSAIECQYDGPAFVKHQGTGVIGNLAWSTDGSLYVIDTQHSVRRYLVEGGDSDCHLRMDTSFGEDGFYNTGDIIGRYIDGLSADAQGHVYASTGASGSYRITGTNVDYHCEGTRGRVIVNSAGTEGVTVYVSQLQRVHFTDTGCTVEEWTADAGNLMPPDRDPTEDISDAFFAGDRLFVGGVSPTLLREMNLDGSPVAEAFGASDNDGRFCSVSEVEACGDNLCVADFNCKELRVIDGSGTSVGSATLHRLMGLPTLAAPHGMTDVRDGSAYFAVTPGLPRGERGAEVYDGFIFRVSGLE